LRATNIRNLFILLAVSFLLSCAGTSGEQVSLDTPRMEQSPKGHVAFFFTGGMQYRDNREAYGEFVYGYESAKPSLLSEGYSYSYHSKLPLEIDNGGLTLSLGAKNLSQAAGFVLIKNNGRFRVVYGIFSGADVVKMAREYFRRRP